MRRRLLKGLIVALGVFGVAEGLARALTGAPAPTLTATIPTVEGGWLRTEGAFVRTTYQGEFELAPIPTDAGERPRVVWLGGSSIRGGNGLVPAHQEAAQLLPQMIDVESLNMGAPGLDSSHLLSMLPEVLGLDPDVLVIYSGHNDLGNVTFQTRFSDRQTVWTTRTRSLLSHSRLFELIDVRVSSVAPSAVPQPYAAKETIDESERSAAHAGFERNLRWIVRGAQEHGVVVILATPMSNPISPPVVWACSELHELPQSPMRTSTQHIPPIVEDVDCADFHWMRGMQAITTGDMETANRSLDAARDTDPTPLRADQAMSAIVVEVAGAEHVTLVDTRAEARVVGGGIEPPHFFADPVHFSAHGHRFVAEHVASALEGLL